jgi:DNA (cytosine-5)-methyltransferase 1
MRHVGDIRKINGGDIEPVDIIAFGSPCQDLSISGRRAGLGGERSGLFTDALRVIKEMRIATNRTCPTRIVWENVPGAFSANGGGDFQTVIEEIAKIAEKGISIPRPPAKSGWLAAGGVMGDNWSLAWRVLDAQYWGVPQRRRRIYLVADFGTQCAGKILFKRESQTWDFTKGENEREGIAGIADSGVAPYVVNIGYSTDRIQMNAKSAVTLRANGGGCGANTGLYCLPVTYCIVGNTIDRTEKSGGNGTGVNEEVSFTLNTADRHAVAVPFIFIFFGDYVHGNIGKTILSSDDITTSDLVVSGYSVRRLTPLECERLQGFPDGWTEFGHNGKRISDNQRYKALGNSVAIPCVQFVLSGMNE